MLMLVYVKNCIRIVSVVLPLLDVLKGSVNENVLAFQKCKPFRIGQRCSLQHFSNDIFAAIDELLCRCSSHGAFKNYQASHIAFDRWDPLCVALLALLSCTAEVAGIPVIVTAQIVAANLIAIV
jgi:hypothetical protein